MDCVGIIKSSFMQAAATVNQSHFPLGGRTADRACVSESSLGKRFGVKNPQECTYHCVKPNVASVVKHS